MVKSEQRLPRIIDSTQVNHAVVGQDKPWYFQETVLVFEEALGSSL